MPITLRLTTDGRIEVEAYLSSPLYHVKGPVTFMLDTGSQKTVLGPRDAETLGFLVASFPPYSGHPLFGVGGKGRPFDVGRCQIVLGTADLVDEEEVLYFAPEKEVRLKTHEGGGRRERRRRVYALPSILGTDILLRNGCSLHVDWKSGTGEIRRG
jgi:hypothetical protein